MLAPNKFWEAKGERNKWQAGGTTEAPDIVNRIQYFFRHRLMFVILAGIDFQHVIEVGPGSGIFARKLIDKYPSITYSAVDISKNLCTTVSNRVPEANAVINTMSHTLPFKDNSFDLYISMGGLTGTKYENKKDALREAKRVLKDGGYLIADEKIADPNPYDNLLHATKWRQLFIEEGLLIIKEYPRRYMWPFRNIKKIAHLLISSKHLYNNKSYYAIIALATLLSAPLELLLMFIKVPCCSSHKVFFILNRKNKEKRA